MKYEVASPLVHEGKSYDPGASVEMSAEAARSLVDSGVLKEIASTGSVVATVAELLGGLSTIWRLMVVSRGASNR